MTTITAENYTLHQGDCMEYMRGMAAGSVDFTFTDPPYKFNGGINGGGIARNEKHNQDKRLRDIISFTPTEFLNALLKSKIMRVFSLAAFCSRDQIPDYAAFSAENEMTLDIHFWHKTDAMPFSNGTFLSDVEYIALVYAPGRHITKGLPRRDYSKVYQSATNKGDDEHPTVKPPPLAAKYISVLSAPGHVVFDPFFGSGTFPSVALVHGRKAIGCELDAAYFAVAQRRIAQAAAQPLLIAPGHVTAEQISFGE